MKISNTLNAFGNQFDEEEAFRIEQEAIQAEKDRKLDKMSNRFESRFNRQQSTVSRHAENRYWVGILSYLPQLLSVIVAFKGARVLMEWVPVPYLDWVMAVIMLVILEVVKRKYSDKFWDQWFATSRINFGAASINFTALIISVILSGFGVWFLIGDNSQEAKTMGLSGDPEAVALQDQIKQLEANIAEHRSNKNEKGVIYWPSQQSIAKLEAQKSDLTTTLREQHGVIVMKNEDILDQWRLRMGYQKYMGLFITLFLEIVFECLMAFCSWYDYKKWLVMKRMSSKANPTSPIAGRRPAGFANNPALNKSEGFGPDADRRPIGFDLPAGQITTPPPTDSPTEEPTAPPPQPVEPEPVEAVPPVPQQSQPPTEPPPQPDPQPAAEPSPQVILVGDLKRNISTYYPRCFPKEVAGKKGSSREATRKANAEKVEAWRKELEGYGIRADIDYEQYKTIEWHS